MYTNREMYISKTTHLCGCQPVTLLWKQSIFVLSILFKYFQGGTIAILSVMERPDFFAGAVFSAASVKVDPVMATTCMVNKVVLESLKFLISIYLAIKVKS